MTAGKLVARVTVEATARDCSRATDFPEVIKCRLYPVLARYTTRYIPRERARSSEVEEAPRAKPEALLRLHESASPFPRDITGRTSRQHVI